MPRLFTVRWPIFARFEALLAFAALLLVCNKVAALGVVLDDVATAEAARLGTSKALLSWGALAFLAAGPYLGLMLAADRLLAIRNGFAWLSAIAIAIWAGVAAILSPDLASLLPAPWTAGTPQVSFTAEAAIAVASATLLIHARPLWIGLNDGVVAGLHRADQSVANPWLVPNPSGHSDEPSSHGARSFLVPTIGLSLVFIILASTWRHHSGTSTAVVSLDDTSQHMPRVVIPGGEATAWRRVDGTFGVDAIVNDHPMPMTFDTGASFVALRAEDAARLGMTTYTLAFTLKVRTANGVTSVAPVTLDTLQVGTITMTGVRAVVAAPGALHESLLGQSFLDRLKDYKVESNSVTFRGE